MVILKETRTEEFACRWKEVERIFQKTSRSGKLAAESIRTVRPEVEMPRVVVQANNGVKDPADDTPL